MVERCIFVTSFNKNHLAHFVIIIGKKWSSPSKKTFLGMQLGSTTQQHQPFLLLFQQLHLDLAVFLSMLRANCSETSQK